MRARHAALVALALALVAIPGVAAAYPQYQFSSGSERCADCHVAPAGAGVLTEWGRGEMGETLAMGGDGRLLHAFDQPEWLALGGDLRLAGLVRDNGSDIGAERALFPMQVEAAVRVGSGGVAATVVAGILPDRSLFSREHFVTHQHGDGPWQVRAGRFAAPFGLRLADHTAYVRRYTGYGLYEETYGVGVSRLGDQSDLHVTGFVSDPVQWSLERAAGAAILYERRAPGRALRGSTRVSAGERELRGLAGVSGTLWFEGPKLALLGELDGGWQVLRDAGEGRPTATAYLGPTWFPTRGLNLTVAAELHAEDLRLPEAHRYAGSAALSLMPWAHVELAASARYQRIGTADHATTAMLQVHLIP
jgi:hypothetical protein